MATEREAAETAELGSTGWQVLKVIYSIFPALEAPSQALKPCILTIVWIGLHSADAQVLAEERHGGVLRVRTLGGHGAACCGLHLNSGLSNAVPCSLQVSVLCSPLSGPS